MEKVYTKFESVFNSASVNKGDLNINLVGLGLALLATGFTISVVQMMFAR